MNGRPLRSFMMLALMPCFGIYAFAQEKQEPEVKPPTKGKHGLSVAKARRIGNKQLAEDPKVQKILVELDRIVDEVNRIYESSINIAREDRTDGGREAKLNERDGKLRILHARREALTAQYEEHKNTNSAYQALQKRAGDLHSKNKEATRKNAGKAKREAMEEENR